METIDEIQILKLKSGDRLALDHWYNTFRSPSLQWLSKSYKLNMEDLVDLYQDSMIVFYRNLVSGKLDNRTASYKTYVFAICQNLAKEKWPESKQNLQHPVDKRLIEDWGLNVHEHIDNDQEKQSVKNAIQKMDAPCNEIVSLFYYHRNSIEVIQDKMGFEGIDVVRTQIKICVEKLRKC